MSENLNFRCLQDAGMPQKIIEQCAFLLQKEQEQAAITLLKNWRSVLLTQLYRSQKQIDYLDYFYISYNRRLLVLLRPEL